MLRAFAAGMSIWSVPTENVAIMRMEAGKALMTSARHLNMEDIRSASKSVGPGNKLRSAYHPVLRIQLSRKVAGKPRLDFRR